MSCTIDYPIDVPSECVREIVRIARSGRWFQERTFLAKHAWVVQGFLQRLLLGEPNPLVGDPSPCTDDTAIRALEALQQSPSMNGNNSLAQSLPIPVSALLEWLVRKLLEVFLAR